MLHASWHFEHFQFPNEVLSAPLSRMSPRRGISKLSFSEKNANNAHIQDQSPHPRGHQHPGNLHHDVTLNIITKTSMIERLCEQSVFAPPLLS